MNETNSVLQNWVMELPRRFQGTLLTCIRGCDLAPKYPLESPERRLVGWLRFCIMNPADPREVGITGAFFEDKCPIVKPSMFGHYPVHWVMHIVHSLEVIGYCHPDQKLASLAHTTYRQFVLSFHFNFETKEQMYDRLTEDRIKKGNVVS